MGPGKARVFSAATTDRCAPTHLGARGKRESDGVFTGDQTRTTASSNPGFARTIWVDRARRCEPSCSLVFDGDHHSISTAPKLEEEVLGSFVILRHHGNVDVACEAGLPSSGSRQTADDRKLCPQGIQVLRQLLQPLSELRPHEPASCSFAWSSESVNSGGCAEASGAASSRPPRTSPALAATSRRARAPGRAKHRGHARGPRVTA